VKFDEEKAMRCSLERELQLQQIRRFWLQRKNLRKLWSSHKQRSREWRHPLKQRHPEMEGSEPGKLTDYCMMLERMWEHPHHNAGRGGHQIGTLATWL
jgi:hypothetical protein